ncbi:MAG: hypothetical protein ACO1RT_06995 [Planctomycetaceae bacterium]
MDDEQNDSSRIAGCLAAVGSALLTGFLLFLNGGVVLASLNALSSGGLTFLRNESFSQFVVLIGPVILVIIEWIMIDYLRTRFSRRRARVNGQG